MPETVVLMAFRGDGEGFGGSGWRDRAYTVVRPHVTQLGYPLRIADSGDEPFSISRSYNQAADCDWDKAIIHSPDEWVPLDQIREAVARASGNMVYAFDRMANLTAEGTEAFYGGVRTFTDDQVARRFPQPGEMMPAWSGPRVITRDLWDHVGGFDETLVGWGAEDAIFAHCCEVLGKPHQRVSGEMLTLWHPREGDFYAHKDTNRARWLEISQVTDPEALRERLRRS